jgi:hypothetical protein
MLARCPKVTSLRLGRIRASRLKASAVLPPVLRQLTELNMDPDDAGEREMLVTHLNPAILKLRLRSWDQLDLPGLFFEEMRTDVSGLLGRLVALKHLSVELGRLTDVFSLASPHLEYLEVVFERLMGEVEDIEWAKVAGKLRTWRELSVLRLTPYHKPPGAESLAEYRNTLVILLENLQALKCVQLTFSPFQR